MSTLANYSTLTLSAARKVAAETARASFIAGVVVAPDVVARVYCPLCGDGVNILRQSGQKVRASIREQMLRDHLLGGRCSECWTEPNETVGV